MQKMRLPTQVFILLFISVIGILACRLGLEYACDGLTKTQLLPSNKLVGDGGHRRRLWGLSMSSFIDPRTVLDKPFGASDVHHRSDLSAKFDLPQLSEYNHQNIMITTPAFSRELYLLYYNPEEDAFLIYIDERKDPYYSQVFSPVWSRLQTVMPALTFALRNHFPERFQGEREFMVLVSTGDTPKLTCDCVDEEERRKRPNFCKNELFAPILQFGSIYKDTAILPNVVPMPVWTHVPCFEEWQRDGSICKDIMMRHDVAGTLADGQSMQMASTVWDTLIPTILWRGSDFFFLVCIHSALLPVEWDRDVAPNLERFGNHARGILQSLLERWDNLTPRWKAVALSAIDSLARQNDHAWIDAKFIVKSKIHGKEVDLADAKYQPFQDYGIQSTSDFIDRDASSRYKYHLDLGGGGGTTWYGTLEKLGMPGVLFHHMTSSKDYFHDELLPWQHFIPVNEDLSNLREMFDWAEANSDAARKISEAGTEYVRNQANPEVMKARYEKYYMHSLRQVLDAYVPMELEERRVFDDWLLKLQFSLVGKCLGNGDKCEFKNWREAG